jgi:hypothetical protein
MEPLEAVISTRSSGSYKGSSFVNSGRKPAERCVCCKHSIVGTILSAFKSRLVWSKTPEMPQKLRRFVVAHLLERKELMNALLS